jgi:hypothetical protein
MSLQYDEGFERFVFWVFMPLFLILGIVTLVVIL